jgi:hypothetical protein
MIEQEGKLRRESKGFVRLKVMIRVKMNEIKFKDF